MKSRRPRQFADTLQNARTLRRLTTQAEGVLWRRLRNRAFAGLKFRRQSAIGEYILDFYCAERRIGIELDGFGHENRVVEDELRTRELRSRRIRLLRFWNTDVLENMESVLEEIARAARDAGV